MKKRKKNRKQWIFCISFILVAGVVVYFAISGKHQEFIDAARAGAGNFLQTFSETTQQRTGNEDEAQQVSFTDTEATEEIQEHSEQEKAQTVGVDISETESCLEDEATMEASAMEQNYQMILHLSAGEIAAEGLLDHDLADRLFFQSEIKDEIFDRINGKSYTPNEYIQPAELSYLRMLYYGADGNTYVGEMIVNKQIEADVLSIFRELYENQYPIERMELIDQYNAEDEASMENNNTSAFNYRTISGSSKLSNHSYGMAIDLNPKYNPYVKTAADGSVTCQPAGSLEYADRSKEFAYKIDEHDLAYQLFTQAGFTWGGNWNSVKDYQHFEKEY